jgi:hypothetical protein
MKHCWIALGVLILVLGFMIIRKSYTNPLHKLNNNKEVVLVETSNTDMREKIRSAIPNSDERIILIRKLKKYTK